MGASSHRRRKSRKAYVYDTDPKSKKMKQLPRAMTKHLDHQPDEVAEAWIDSWAKDNGINRDRIARKYLKETDRLMVLWKQYQEQKAADFDSGEGRRAKTIDNEKNVFLNHIVPFFVEIKEKKDPSYWSPLVPEFHTHLSNQRLKPATRRLILWTLKRFSESLVFSGYLHAPFAIRPPRSKNEKITPLKIKKTPEEIIKFVKNTTFPSPKIRRVSSNPNGERGDIDFILAIFLGYFGGFGPGELFALEKADLLTGEYAVKNTKTHDGFKKCGLGSKLSVVINKTLPAVGEVVPLVKNDYRYGVSNIWHADAAKLIASIVAKKPEGRLFPHSYAYMMTRWREQVKITLRTTPHDLRRASGLYLGENIAC